MFTMRLRDRRVQMTYPVRLTCQMIGSPTPEVKWYHDGKELNQDGELASVRPPSAVLPFRSFFQTGIHSRPRNTSTHWKSPRPLSKMRDATRQPRGMITDPFPVGATSSSTKESALTSLQNSSANWRSPKSFAAETNCALLPKWRPTRRSASFGM